MGLGAFALSPSWLEEFFSIPMFFYILFLTFLTQANDRVKTIGDIIKKIKNSKILDQSCLLGSWVNGICAKSVRSRSISHKLQFKIPFQIFIHLHFIGPSSLQALYKVNLYLDNLFFYMESHVFKLQCEGRLKS